MGLSITGHYGSCADVNEGYCANATAMHECCMTCSRMRQSSARVGSGQSRVAARWAWRKLERDEFYLVQSMKVQFRTCLLRLSRKASNAGIMCDDKWLNAIKCCKLLVGRLSWDSLRLSSGSSLYKLSGPTGVHNTSVHTQKRLP